MEVAFIGIKGLPARGGAERVVEAIVNRLPDSSIHSTIYCDASYTPEGYSLDGIKLIRLPSIRSKYIHMFLLDLLAALDAVTFRKYDLIHLHHREASFVLPILRLRYRIVCTSHGAAYWRDKWGPLAKFLLRLMDVPFIKLSDVVTSVSANDSHELEQKYGQCISYIPNGVELNITPDKHSARLIQQKHDLEPGQYLIFVAGRIVPTKGAHLAIEAVNNLPSQIPLLVVGDGHQLPEYSLRLKQVAGPYIHFEPLVENLPTLYGLMTDALCLLFPSSVEAMSMVLLEAASVNVPIICSDIPENRSVLHDDAVYFQSNDVQDLIKQIIWIGNHTEQVSGLSQRARDRVRREFSWDAVASRYVEIYLEAIKKP